MSMGRRVRPAIDRLLEKCIETPSGCWQFTGTLRNGYSRIRAGRAGSPMLNGHRISWEFFRAPLAPGFQIDHLCKNRACVNPDHLEPVTQAENIRRSDGWSAINARKTHCPSGHAYDRVDGRGYRTCSTCRQADGRRKGRRLDQENAA